MIDALFILLLIIIVLFLFVVAKIESLAKKEISFTLQLKKISKEYLSIKKEKERVLASIDNLIEGFLILDKDNRVEYANSQFCKILGLQCGKILNKEISELKDFPKLSQIVSLLQQDIKYSFKKEIKISEDLILEVFIDNLNINKNYLGKAIVLHDITKEKTMDKVKRDFVSLTAHQLNVPLSTTKLSLEMLLDGSLGKITDEQRDIIEKTYKRNDMLIYLVADLLDIAKIEEKGNSYNWEFIDFESLVKDVIGSDQLQIKKKKIKFEIIKPKVSVPKILLDKSRIFLAIKNIFDNAVKYTPENGKIIISFDVNKKPARNASHGDAGGELEFKISDSGIGIPENQKNKLFDKFFRSTNAIKMEPSGSGLGLFIAKNIIEAHGGKIWFDSVENKGSTFFFTIPLRQVE